MTTCAFVPPTPGYAPCTRDINHDGPCAHHLDENVITHTITITVLERTNARPWETDRFHVSSDFPNISVEGHNEKDSINFVKGALLASLGMMHRTIPDKLIIDFRVVRKGPHDIRI